jgi:hypothetical protein
MRASWLAPALFLVAVAAVNWCPAAPYHGAHGYQLTLPDDWKPIPAEKVQAASAAMQKPGAEHPLVFDAGFQRADASRWFEYPYALVQVISYAAAGAPHQINEDEFPDAVKAITGTDLRKNMDSVLSQKAKSIMGDVSTGEAQLDTPHRRYLIPMNMTVGNGIGKVRGLIVGNFGHNALVQVCFYAKQDDWDQYSATCQSIVDSFKFDPAEAYSVEAAAANPTRRFDWSRVWTMTAAGAVIGAFIGLIRYLTGKTRKA